MQEKENTVFIVATANDISKLPPEFLRKGRFDELFFVELPDEDERRKILKIHLNKRNKMNREISLSRIAHETNGCNGADLEGLVKEAIETAFGDGCRDLTTEDLLDARKNNKPITELLKDKLKELDKQRIERNFKSANEKVANEKKADKEKKAEKPKADNQALNYYRQQVDSVNDLTTEAVAQASSIFANTFKKFKGGD